MRKWIKRILRFLLKATLWFLGLTILWVIIYRWVDPPITYLQVREWIKCPEDQEFMKEWSDLEETDFNLHLAVVSSEDQNFMEHRGFDFGAIEKAIEHNKNSEKTRGASTISQQTAKNVFLWPGRSWVRKGLEVYFTFLIETFWSKQRIMEVYLNMAETGNYTFGAEAAAQKYFGKSCQNLNAREAALIAAILPTPRKSNPGKPSAYLTKRGKQIEQQMRYLGKDYFERHGDPDWPD